MFMPSLVFFLFLSCALVGHAKPVNQQLQPQSIPDNVANDLGIDHPMAGLKVVLESKNPISQYLANVSVQPLVLKENGQEFEIRWSGVSDPKTDDWIAIYMADANPFHKAPVQYFEAGDSDTHLPYGHGTLKVRLFNHRGNMKVVFLRSKGDKLKSVLTACPEVIEVQNPYEPLRIQLSLTKNSREVLVQWIAKPSPNPIVKWGSASSHSTEVIPAESTTYSADDMCGAPATKEGFFDPGSFYSAVLTGLIPGKMYKYQVGDKDLGLSKYIRFKAPGSSHKLKVAAVGDMGQSLKKAGYAGHDGPTAIKTSQYINAEKDLDLVFHIGDIAYAMGYVAGWDLFMDQWGDVITKVPYMVTIGNHERDWPHSGDRYDISYNSGGECGVAYERRFKMPRAGVDKPWYSYEMGPVHFTVMSGEHEFKPGSEQYRFLEKDFAAVDRTRTPWLVLAGHRPMYLSITKDDYPTGYYTVSIELRKLLEDLLIKYKVDMMWSGHHHSYHRSCPVYQGSCIERPESKSALAPVHFVFGTAGASLYRNLVATPFGRVALDKHGYLRAEATKDSFFIEFISNADGSVLDSYKLEKSAQWEMEWTTYWESAGSYN